MIVTVRLPGDDDDILPKANYFTLLPNGILSRATNYSARTLVAHLDLQKPSVAVWRKAMLQYQHSTYFAKSC